MKSQLELIPFVLMSVLMIAANVAFLVWLYKGVRRLPK